MYITCPIYKKEYKKFESKFIFSFTCLIKKIFIISRKKKNRSILRLGKPDSQYAHWSDPYPLCAKNRIRLITLVVHNFLPEMDPRTHSSSQRRDKSSVLKEIF